jgi:hypothetical protein
MHFRGKLHSTYAVNDDNYVEMDGFDGLGVGMANARGD